MLVRDKDLSSAGSVNRDAEHFCAAVLQHNDTYTKDNSEHQGHQDADTRSLSKMWKKDRRLTLTLAGFAC